MERIQELSAGMLPVPSPAAALPSAQDLLRMINQLQKQNFEQADKLRMIADQGLRPVDGHMQRIRSQMD